MSERKKRFIEKTDADLNEDMKIGLGVGPGNTVAVFYRSFSVEVDWPWGFDGISRGISKIVEGIVEGRIEGEIKNKMLNTIRIQINDAASKIPDVLTSSQTLQDELPLKVC